MTAEELLKPRYKVIADYIFSPYKIGDIIQTINNYNSVQLAVTDETKMGEQRKVEHFYDINDCSLFPAIFKRLEWWEEREENNMPEYVKWNPKWSKITKVFSLIDLNSVKQPQLLSATLPATKEEYENHKSIKT